MVTPGKYNAKHKTQNTSRQRPFRNLSPLANEEQKQQMQIDALSYDFACRITRLFQYLTEESNNKEFIISKQIMRSGTSIGANVSEGQNAQSKADFLSKMSIASKEANETHYWLRLLHDNGYIDDTQYDSINKDMQRILNKLIAIVKTTKQNMEKK